MRDVAAQPGAVYRLSTEGGDVKRRRMAGMRVLLVLALVVAAIAWAACCPWADALASSGPGGWSKQSSGTTVDLYGVAFADASHGWVVGGSMTTELGTILATTNGGVTWKAQLSGNVVSLEGVACADASHAWAVGEDGTILATTDGGVTWRAQSSGTEWSLYDVAFTDATHGWAVGVGGTILATTNGGATWEDGAWTPWRCSTASPFPMPPTAGS